MLRATKTKVETHHHVILKEPQATEGSQEILRHAQNDSAFDRLSHAKNFADELSDSRLRKSKLRWTVEKRAEKGAIIRLHRPWESSTGPKTVEGKRRAARNSHLYYSAVDRLFVRLFRLQNRYRAMGEILYTKRFPKHPLMLRRAMFTLEKLLLKMRKDLEAAKVETASLDARILMRQGGNFSDADLITKAFCPLSEEAIDRTLKLLDRRLRGEPVSRILGEREFWGLSFKVTPDTLDPRADTETLVDAALKKLRFMGNTSESSSRAKSRDLCPLSNEEDSLPHKGVRNDGMGKGIRILDLGTGTGCIPIALLKELPGATAVAVDISAPALEVARANAARHGVESRIEFRHGSWFEPVKQGEMFDLITSNPPYIPESEIESLATEVRNHDPFGALSGGIDGLDAYKIILKDMKKHLGCGGFALLEIGAGQEKDLARIVRESKMTREESYADLGGIVRVLEIRMGKSENIFDAPR